MPLPFIVAGIAAVAGAVGTTAAAVGTAAAVVGTTAVAAAGTVAAVAGTTLLTVGGLSITVGGVAAAAAGFGIASKVFEDTSSYSSEYITDSQKEYEKNKLKDKLETEKKELKHYINIESSTQIKTEIEQVLLQVNELQNNNDYFKAINAIQSYKIIYAQGKSNEKIAKEAEEVAKLLLEVRHESRELVG